MKKLFTALLLLFAVGLSHAATLAAGGVQTFDLAPGKKLTITTAAASTAIVQRYNGPTLIESVSLAAGATRDFGEYFMRQQFRVSALTGSLTYTEAQSTDPVGAVAQITSGTIDSVVIGGTTAAAGSFTMLTAGSHAVVTGPTPTMGSCGTSPSVVGSDNGMTVTVGSGGAATDCVITFGTAWTNEPACNAQSNTDVLPLAMVTTTTGLTVTKAAAFTAGSKLHIVCVGW